MNPSGLFIRRPVAATLLTFGLALAGAGAFFLLPVSPLPKVDYPTISVTAQLPGASPETVASSVATPLERHLGQIADVTEMTSTSSVGVARITLQFSLDRDIDGAARDVQAAINAARVDLPAALRSNPTYRKVNPADAPILIMTLTSRTLSQGRMYDSAATVLQQKLSQVEGVGQVSIGGSSLPAVRVELNPDALFKYGIGLEDVRAAIASTNANAPKGAIEIDDRHLQIQTNDQARRAADYRRLIIAYRDDGAVRLSDVAEIVDSVEDLRNQGLANGKPSVLVIVSRAPGANIIETVDRVVALLPELRAAIPEDIDLTVANDRTTAIRASLAELQKTLGIAVVLVVAVVLLFLRDLRAAWIPGVAVPVSLLGTFGVMYLLDYSLDNLSLMALTVATGFVVDDAVVVLENITRHMEAGMSRRAAALKGSAEVGFTVLSMSVSLVAVFIPILLMGGLIGRLFREFAMVLSISVMMSLVVSLTTTPMMCATLLREHANRAPGLLARRMTAGFDALAGLYAVTLGWALRHRFVVLLALFATIGCNIYLYGIVPKGFFPQQDTGRLVGGIRGDQSISFQAMREKLRELMRIVGQDPAVETVVGFTGGAQTNGGSVFVALKPLGERDATSDEVIQRLRRKLAIVPGVSLFLQTAQDLRIGGRQSNSQFSFSLQGDNLDELRTWAPRLVQALQGSEALTDIDSDQQDRGLEANVVIDRPTAARLGVSVSQIDNTLYDAFGQRQVSTIYSALNQYHVVMEVAPSYAQTTQALDRIYISTSGGAIAGTQATNNANSAAVANQRANALASVGKAAASTGSAVSTTSETMVPLSALAHVAPGATPLGVNHQGQFVATTLSFNLPPGKSLGEAVTAINRAMVDIHMPESIHAAFAGSAQAFQNSLSSQPLLILAALITIYIVLGILYESFIHPLTILSTLPSAGIGALLALLATGTEFSLIALIGVILLIGIVKKNAIMMVDFAIHAERTSNFTPEQAIFEACRLRFRPIMMTTLAALLGAIPLAIGVGTGAELRQPLGISIVGGLVLSQILTLYTTPVVFLYLDRLRRRPRAAEVLA